MMNHDLPGISPLSVHTVSNVQTMITTFIEGHSLDDLRMIKHAHWIAVPVESAAHFDSDDQQRLVDALSRRHIPYLYALIFEGWDGAEGVMVRVCHEGIAALDHAYSHFNSILVGHLTRALLLDKARCILPP